MNATELAESVAELVDRLDTLFGLYLDAQSGFECLSERIVNVPRPPTPDGGEPRFHYGTGDPNDPNNVVWHRTTLADLLARNSRGGRNQQLLSQYFVVLMYHLWEGEYRARISSALESAEAVANAVFGDIRHLRNDILKHRGVLSEERARKLETIHLQPNEPIALSGQQLYELLRIAKSSLDELVTRHTGVDPLHRTIWHMR
jgi:hypothetical protein